MQMILLTTNAQGMSDDLKGAIITAFVTGVISIIGFVLTNLSMKRNFKNELLKEKVSVHIEKMSEMPYHILELMEKMIKTPSSEEVLEEFKKNLNTICAYGSSKAIEIASTMQSENYLYSDKEDRDKYRVIAFYALLVTQIKYDVTGIINSPEMWYMMKMTDYRKGRSKFQESNNQIVRELKLNSGFKI